jgi:hypothetical protein
VPRGARAARSSREGRVSEPRERTSRLGRAKSHRPSGRASCSTRSGPRFAGRIASSDDHCRRARSGRRHGPGPDGERPVRAPKRYRESVPGLSTRYR